MEIRQENIISATSTELPDADIVANTSDPNVANTLGSCEYFAIFCKK